MAETKVKFRRGFAKLDDQAVIDEIPEDRVSDPTEFLQHQIRYEPRKSEALVIARIESTVDDLMKEFFVEADRGLERLYASVRVPLIEDGMPKLEDGQVVWETDPFGNPLEDWNRL